MVQFQVPAPLVLLPQLERARREVRVDPAGAVGPTDQDRKSTRLNSSHGYISYAVFCLKKKKKNELNCIANKKNEDDNITDSIDTRVASVLVSVCTRAPSRIYIHTNTKSQVRTHHRIC